jgi:AraC family transcriptional regulator, positive regulator of tynA and feaB
MTEKMLQSFTTDHIPVSDRQEAWLWNAKQICGPCNFQFPRRFPFHGSISRRKLADLEMTLFSSSALSFNKYPVANTSLENRACIVITQLQGLRRYCQNGNVAILRKGDATLIDSSVPWSSDCPGDCARLYLSGSLFEQAESLGAAEGVSAMEGYLRILQACIGGNQPAHTGTHRVMELSTRITDYIETHLPESTLGPVEIASALRISIRHVHRVFSNQGSTVADWIRTQRLQRCRTDLCDPRLQGKSITEISFYWGFNDSAHFSHAFKKQYQMSPRAFRSRVSAGLPLPDDATDGRKSLQLSLLRRLRAS